MSLKINKDFAQKYNKYRKKEEYEKLKAKYGDANVNCFGNNSEKSKNTNDRNSEDHGTNSDCEDSDDYSTSSDSDDDNDSWVNKENEDFLNLYKALCNNDPTLNDPNKQWFRDPDETDNTEMNELTNSQNIATQNNNTNGPNDKKKNSKVKLRDYQREFLLKHGGLEDEFLARAASQVAQTESEDILQKLENQSKSDQKEQFLREAKEALHCVSYEDNENDLDFLKKREFNQNKDHNQSSKRKATINPNDLKFTDSGNNEAEEFLRNYFINQRWRDTKDHSSSKQFPSYSEVLHQAGLDLGGVDQNMKNYLSDDDILDEDEEFLVKVADFEQNRLNSINNLSNDAQTQKTQFRFQEKDKEFIKSYPRQIENSIHQYVVEKSKRAQKRQARNERKKDQKRIKMEEMNRLRKLKLSIFADKIERIKRSCGPNSLISNINSSLIDISPNSNDKDLNDNQLSESKTNQNQIDSVDIADYLDEDWDPNKHNEFLDRMFGEKYENIQDDLEKPKFSDDSDLDNLSDTCETIESKNSPLSSKTANCQISNESTKLMNAENLDGRSDSRRCRNRKRSRFQHILDKKRPVFDPDKYPDYEQYFDEHYKLNYEDIIPGPTPDEDVFCRFKYREVMPNDFGLTTEEILKAEIRELNAWAPLKKVVAYRTQAEEEKDKLDYASQKKKRLKTRVIGSLNDPGITWWPQENPGDTKTKRRRRRKKKQDLSSIIEKNINEIHSNENDNDEKVKAKLEKSKSRKSKCGKSRRLGQGVISDSRLQAAGITPKEYYRAIKHESKTHSKLDVN